MKSVSNVSDLQSGAVDAAAAVRETRKTTVAVATVRAPAANDQVQLSKGGLVVSRVLAASDARLDKVAGLQQAIAGGTYHVAAGDVADKLITALLG